MKRILQYIRETYHPSGLILYGSYAAGTQTPQSDFDALAIGSAEAHDVSVVDGVALDLYVYSKRTAEAATDSSLLRLSGGKLLFDTDGVAGALLERANQCAARPQAVDKDSCAVHVAWCEKMLRRAQRGDAEGNFRCYWLLTESLRICCELCGLRYLGPKKALEALNAKAPALYRCYVRALAEGGGEALEAWVHALRRTEESI